MGEVSAMARDFASAARLARRAPALRGILPSMSIAAIACALLALSTPAPQPPAPRAPAEGIERSSFRWAQSPDGGWVLVAAIDPLPGWHVYWENPATAAMPRASS